MAQWLKQSTASQVINFGPFVDKTDGVTFQTDLVGTSANQLEHASSGILISKNGGTLAARNSPAASAYDAYGMYKVTLDATDTATCGRLVVAFGNAADVLPVWKELMVVPANVYDSLVTGVNWLPVTGLQADFSISGATLTVNKQDGSTAQFTKTITSQAGAAPIIGLDT